MFTGDVPCLVLSSDACSQETFPVCTLYLFMILGLKWEFYEVPLNGGPMAMDVRVVLWKGRDFK